MMAASSTAQTNANGKIIAYRGSPSLTKRQLARHHMLLAKEYERAARYPWLPVPPDPPLPE